MTSYMSIISLGEPAEYCTSILFCGASSMAYFLSDVLRFTGIFLTSTSPAFLSSARSGVAEVSLQWSCSALLAAASPRLGRVRKQFVTLMGSNAGECRQEFLYFESFILTSCHGYKTLIYCYLCKVPTATSILQDL